MAQEPTEFNWNQVGPKKPPAASVQPQIEQPLASARSGNTTVHDVSPEPKQSTPATPEPTFDWGRVYAKKPQATIGAEQHPIENRLNQLANDIKFGPPANDDRIPERLMRFLGYQGTQKGQSGNPGGMMPIVGAVEGVPELIHATSRVPQIQSKKDFTSVFNEGAGGAFKTVAGAAGAVSPLSVVPGMARALPAYAAGSTGAKLFGADPDTQQMVGNITAAGLPGEKAAGEKVGPLIEQHAPALGKATGYVAAAGKAAHDVLGGKGFNPLDLIFASPLGTKPAEAAFRTAGSLMGNSEPLIMNGPEKPAAPAPAPKQLGPGNIELNPPADTGKMEVPRAQAQVVRGKGGKMTKQFTTSPDSGKVQFGTEKPLIQTDFGEPKAPPNAAGTVEPVGKTPEAQAKPATKLDEINSTVDQIVQNLQQAIDMNSHEEDQASLDRKAGYEKELKEWQDFKNSVNQPGYSNPHIDLTAPAEVKPASEPINESSAVKGLDQPAPTEETEPLTNRRSTDIIDNGMPKKTSEIGPKDLEEKGLQQDLRNKFDRDQEAADEHGLKAMYKGMKPGYNPDVESPQPFSEHPFGKLIDNGEEDYEPPEGASASLKGPGSTQSFINPFTGGHEAEPDFSSDELDRLYGNDVQKELINNKESELISQEVPKEVEDAMLHIALNTDTRDFDGVADLFQEKGLDPFNGEDVIKLAQSLGWKHPGSGNWPLIEAMGGQDIPESKKIPEGEDFHHFEPDDEIEHELSFKDADDESLAWEFLKTKGFTPEQLAHMPVRELVDTAKQHGFQFSSEYPRSKWTKEMIDHPQNPPEEK